MSQDERPDGRELARLVASHLGSWWMISVTPWASDSTFAVISTFDGVTLSLTLAVSASTELLQSWSAPQRQAGVAQSPGAVVAGTPLSSPIGRIVGTGAAPCSNRIIMIRSPSGDGDGKPYPDRPPA